MDVSNKADLERLDASTANTTAALLTQGKYFDQGSNVLLIIICLVLLWQTNISTLEFLLALLSVCVWFIQKYYAIRVGFDSLLFGHLAAAGASKTAILHLDQSIQHIFPNKTLNSERGLSDRLKGAIQLLLKQLACLVCLLMVFVCVLFIQYI